MRYSRYNVWADLDDSEAVFNGTSGALVHMTRGERHDVDAFASGAADGTHIAELLERLVEARVLVGDDADELSRLRARYDQSRFAAAGLGYTIVTSLGCNFDCPYCFEAKHPSLLKPPVADALVQVLEDSLPSIDGLGVTWMGGEPLLGAEQLFDLSSRFMDVCDANDKGYRAGIITNGWYLDEVMARRLSAHRVGSAQVTIDGPPDVHDAKRPRRNGGATFDRVLSNVAEAADHLSVSIRINVDTENASRVEELLVLLAERGLAGRVGVGLGRVTDAVSNPASPLAGYHAACLTAREFGSFELVFRALAERYGFGFGSLPRPVGTPCTAVRSGEIVVGSDGEMWKCWDDIGNPAQAIGTVFDYRETNAELQKWLAYHPADDPQCSTCVAMPVCMGGCAHHDFHSPDSEARCGAFRHNHREQVAAVARRELGLDVGEVPPPPVFDAVPRPSRAVPVTIGRR